MAVVNHDKREIQFKVVYCGTPRGGKTTNLQYIHQKLDTRFRGDLVSIATSRDRTIFFDFLPVNSFEIEGYQTRFQLYTVPGQAVYEQTRNSVLNGADGVVFVADSSPDRQDANVESWKSCKESLMKTGRDPEHFPLVLQYNKRDLYDAVAPFLIDEKLKTNLPAFPTCASSGYRVFATLDYVTQNILKEFHLSNVKDREGSREIVPIDSGADSAILVG